MLKGLIAKVRASVRAQAGAVGFCLGFHSINHERAISELRTPEIVTTPDNFRAILQAACAVAEPAILSATRLPTQWFAVTFDDGFRDNSEFALSILEEFNVPATIFLATGFAQGCVLPYEIALSRIIAAERVPANAGGDRELYAMREKRDRYARLRLPLKSATLADREAGILRLNPSNDLASEIYGMFLQPAGIRELSRHPLIEIGSHGIAHLVLPAQSRNVIRRELAESKTWIEQQTGRQCTSFAFPYGEFDKDCVRQARAMGYRNLFTTQRQNIIGPARYVVPRYMCDGMNALPPACLADFEPAR